MRVKVCGMRDPENIAALAALPLDYIGFIFYAKSPRAVKGDKLEKWLRGAGKDALPGIARVGVFVNAEIEEVLNRVHDYQLDFVQLHGEESPEYCRELIAIWDMSTMRRAGIIKAFSVDDQFDFSKTASYSSSVHFFLFDTKGALPGGTGEQFDWSVLEKYTGQTPFLLSGGIGPQDIARVRQFRHNQFLGVDLNSRFELAPGQKDIPALADFMNGLHQEG